MLYWRRSLRMSYRTDTTVSGNPQTRQRQLTARDETVRQGAVKLQARPRECGLTPAQLMQVVQIGKRVLDIRRAHIFEIDPAVAGNAAPQVPDTAACRLTQVSKVGVETGTQIRLIADTAVELAHIVVCMEMRRRRTPRTTPGRPP